MNSDLLVEPLRTLGEAVRDAVRKALAGRTPEERLAVHGKAASDVIYRIDLDAERVILEGLEPIASSLGGLVLVAEGIGEDSVNVFPKGQDPDRAAWRLLMDPIDGTRSLMVGKRSAFFLVGAAPNKGPGTRLSDIQAAVMVEIPTDRSNFSDVFWARRDRGIQGYTRDLNDRSLRPRQASPSQEPSIYGGFAAISRFFHPGKDILASLEEEMIREIFPDLKDGDIPTFEDQYVCSGGQLYELLTGKDRFTADLRHSLYTKLSREGHRVGHECHPYDLAALLVGEEAGVILTDATGEPLDAPFDTLSSLDWAGYANPKIRDQVSPVLTRLVKKHLA